MPERIKACQIACTNGTIPPQRRRLLHSHTSARDSLLVEQAVAHERHGNRNDRWSGRLQAKPTDGHEPLDLRSKP